MMTRQQMEAVIAAGGSVQLPSGAIVTTLAGIPVDRAELERREAELAAERKKVEAAEAKVIPPARAAADEGPAPARAPATAAEPGPRPERPVDEAKAPPRR